MNVRLYISGVALAASIATIVCVLVLVGTTTHDPRAAGRPPIESGPSDQAPPVISPLPRGELQGQQQPARQSGLVRLRAPDLDGLQLDPDLPTRPEGYSKQALALYFRTSLFARPAKKLDVIGFARRGARIPVVRQVSGAGCNKGRWYLVEGGGHVCTSRGFAVGIRPRLSLSYSLPDLSGLLPHRYGKVSRDGAERLFRIPSAREDELIARAADSDDGWPDVVEKTMKGIFFVAVDQQETSTGRAFYRTVRGRYVRAQDVELRPTPPMHGELLGQAEGKTLPLAFVFGEDRPLYRLEAGRLRRVGLIEKHARFRPARTLKHDGRELLQTPGGLLVVRRHVRLVRMVRRPAEIPARQRWIHIDLAQQTLVAYEHDAPVFATLVSSGKQGFEPPTGTFRINKKYISTTMNGPDPDEGWYEVEEVPWTMYYWESYALHGTYWHNDFGTSRSHGCTNLAPADAKWLFYWTDPDLPYGWHARERLGTRIHFTQ